MAKHRLSSRRNTVIQVVAMVFLLVGAVMALYPFYVGPLNDVFDNYRLQRNEAVAQRNSAKRIKKMKQMNRQLQQKGLNANADPFSGMDAHDRRLMKRNQLGAVTVPSLKLNVPLFQTLSEDTLAIGAAVVPGTSMPVGGSSTHTVIAGHRGLVNRRLFSDLNRVHKGDVFVLKVFRKHLAYKVFEIQTVKPEDTDVLKIEPGRDLATLLTCTPYMVNSHRLLITGKRVPYTKKVAKVVRNSMGTEWRQQLGIMAGALACFGIIAFLVGRRIHALMLKRRLLTLRFVRLNKAGVPLAAAKYQLCKLNGKTLYRDAEPLVVETDINGLVVIDRIPGGKYLLKELSPVPKLKFVVGTNKLNQHNIRFYSKKYQQNIVAYENDSWKIVY